MLKRITHFVILPAMAVFLFLTPASSQDIYQPSQSIHEAKIDTLVSILELTDEQIPVVRSIVLEGFNERDAIMASVGVEPGTAPGLWQMMRVRTPMEDSLQRTELQLSYVLSPIQMSQYQRIVEDMRKEFIASLR